MSDIAIYTEGLGKVYRVGQRESYGSLRETVVESVTGIFSFRGWKSYRTAENMVWALRDVSFEIKGGEAMGVIGPNGAGKTTLLKILSRITEPTEGLAEIRGRVGSLLEVGTGFHPELTGRENVYLNGAILGMRRWEIQRKFDEIVSFAEVEKFLDTPVKRYSSGMYVRLAFAVAAHLEPEILLVDEVLSVGDAAFQKKCLGKMEEVTGEGRTVVLVSHNMGAIKWLTRTTVWLEGGRLREIGDSKVVTDKYLSSVASEWKNGFYGSDYMNSRRVRHEKYLGAVRLHGVRLKDDAGNISSVHPEGRKLFVEMTFCVAEHVKVLESLLRVKSPDGALICTSLPGRLESEFAPGVYTATISLDIGPLLPGVYRGDLVLLSNVPQDNVSPAFEFEVVPNPVQVEDFRTVLFGTQSHADYSGLGFVRVKSAWQSLPKLEVTS